MSTCKTLLAALLVTGAAFAQQTAEAPNLLKNGDLSALNESTAPVWTTGGWVFSKWNLKEGTPEAQATQWGVAKDPADEANKCLRVATTAKVKAQVWWQQEVACAPGQSYVLTFKAKGPAAAPGVGPGCGFYVLDPNNKWLLYQPLKDVQLAPEWQEFSGTITVPEDATKLGVRLGVSGEGVIGIFFDDVKLVKAAN